MSPCHLVTSAPWLRRRLLAWYVRNARQLPWRSSRDPYTIWVSEVMLQQTQVATVIPYFERFLQSFPSIAALAQADLEQVLRLWEGLGYYRRARDLHRAAGILHANHSDKIPADADLLGNLPGLGRYTTNAVLSQAFDLRLPILEANSVRVLCRVLGVRQDPKKGTTQRFLWDAAARLLPRKRVGQFNQALMELGALVCTPTKPDCAVCPLAHDCCAHRDNLQELIPLRGKKEKTTEVREVALVLRRAGKVLLAKRPPTGRWADLWEFPHIELEPGETTIEGATRLLAELGIHADLGEEIITLKHAVTRFRITMVCMEAKYRNGRFRVGIHARTKWLTPDQLAQYPVSSPQRSLAHAVAAKR
jgi:A/G-specific adenine glycosylase